MTRRMTAFILTCITVLAAAVPLSACAPQPAEPAFLEKIRDTMIFASQGEGQDNDLSIEAIVPDADSPEVTAYLDKLLTDKGQDAFEYNFDYVKEVMQSDASTVDDALYNALIITFIEMPDDDKETFLECAYIKTEQWGLFGSLYKWNVSPVITEMMKRCKELLENTAITFDNLNDRDCGIQNLIFGYSLLRQAEKYASIDSVGSFSNINIDIRRDPDFGFDAILNFGITDDKGNVKDLYTVNILAFRGDIKGVLGLFLENNAQNLSGSHIIQLIEDGQKSYALRIGASISYTEDGIYEVNLAAVDTFKLNMSLRAFAIRIAGVSAVGLSCSAADVGEAIMNRNAEEIVYNRITIYDYFDWYLSFGNTESRHYYDALTKAYLKGYDGISDFEGLSDNGINDRSDNAFDQVLLLTYEDMRKLEQDYPEYFQ